MPSPHPTISSRSNPTRDANSPQPYIASRSFGHKSGGESFRPQLLGLPKDPFAAKPWIVDLGVLPTSRIRQTILVLGTPPQNDVHALVYSETLRDSLLIIATHDVKPLASFLLPSPTEPNSHSPGPTTRILRLGSPLFPQYSSAPASRTNSVHGSLSPSSSSLPLAPSSGGGSDALRVMSLLNRASQVASSLASCSCDDTSVSRIQQLGENPLTGEFNVFEVLGSASPTSAGESSPSRPASMATSEQVTPKKSKRQTLHGFFSFGSSSSASASPGSASSARTNASSIDAHKFGPSPTAAIFQDGSPGCGSTACVGGKATRSPCGARAFDALINYLPSPSFIPEKIILKQAILITTLSAPYLSGSGAPPPSRLDQQVRERRHTGASMLGIPLSRRSTALSSDGGHSVTSKLDKRRSRLRRNSAVMSLAEEEEESVLDMLDAREKYSGPSHLLHVVPNSTSLFGAKNNPGGHRLRDTAMPVTLSKPKLVAGIEQFILAFAYPAATSFKPSASAAASISSGKGRDSFMPSPSHSTSAIPRSQSSNGMPLATEAGLIAPPCSLIEQLNGKPAPYIVKAGVMGGVFSFSTLGGGQDSVAQTVSIGDLLLFGALDGSIEEQGGGKAWLGGVSVREVAESLCGKVQAGVEVRYTSQSKAIENVWIGGLADDPRRERRSKQAQEVSPDKRPSVSRTLSTSSSGAASTSSGHSLEKSDHSHRSSSKVPRKPAPTLTPSDSMTAAWNALQTKVKLGSSPSPTPPGESEASPVPKTRRKERRPFNALPEDDREEPRQERQEKDLQALRNRKSTAWNPETGLLTPPGSSSEKGDSESGHHDTNSPPLPSVDDRAQKQLSASPPTENSTSQAEESFDFASCYQYDKSQCPQALAQSTERKRIAKYRERTTSQTLPSCRPSKPERRRTLSAVPPSPKTPSAEGEVFCLSHGAENWERVKTPSVASKGAVGYAKTLHQGDIPESSVVGSQVHDGNSRQPARETKPSYHYTKASTNGHGETTPPACDGPMSSLVDTPVKGKASASRLGKFLGRVLSIRGSPDSQSTRRRRRLSVASPNLQ